MDTPTVPMKYVSRNAYKCTDGGKGWLSAAFPVKEETEDNLRGHVQQRPTQTHVGSCEARAVE